MSHLPLGPGGEFDRIRGIIERVGSSGVALGDDCALMEWPGGTLALSTDATVEDVHFRRAWLSGAEIGWRAAARALSDLAAEGAEALGILVALTAPRAAAAETIAEVMGGAADAVRAVGGRVLGGDLAAGDRWHLVVTVVGTAAQPVTRAGAEPGNELWVTGALGGAGAALDAWLGGVKPDPTARRAFATPMPRIAAGVALAASGARAMIDLSDGLGGDARHLAAASSVRLMIDLDRLPLAPAARSALDAARGGEDYELLVAMPADFGPASAGVSERTRVPLTKIGHVEAGTGVVLLLAGVETEVPGWDHFVDAPRRLG